MVCVVLIEKVIAELEELSKKVSFWIISFKRKDTAFLLIKERKKKILSFGSMECNDR